MPENPETAPSALRSGIDRAIGSGDTATARALLIQLTESQRDVASAAYIVSRFERLRPSISLTPCRLAVLRSFTLEPVLGSLRALAFAGGIDLQVHLGGFDQYPQEILDPAGALYAFAPEVILLAVLTRDIAPDLWFQFADLEPAAIEGAVRRTIDRFEGLLGGLRSRSSASLVVHSLESPRPPAFGVLDSRLEQGQCAAIRRINDAIVAWSRAHANVHVLDYDALVTERGQLAWEDPRRWLTVRMPISASEIPRLAERWMRFLHPITGRTAKCAVVDLDNTLWGGVIGEDGLAGIRLDEGYPGAAYRDVQRALLDLYRRGILLAICSKNNPPDALEAFQQHRGMILRADHFAAVRINWDDKVSNLREIASELNIGVDSLAFIDDSPAERAWVRSQLPEVTVVELPEDPLGFGAAIRRQPVFERLTLSDEDRERGRMYVEQRLRTELQRSATSIEDFYRSLGMKIEVEGVTASTLARTAQLTQKTNQFNVTTRRYTEQQIEAMIRADSAFVYTLRVLDRFGDNGLVGVAITRRKEDTSEIDTFLLSCRVIGRTVETAFLATIAEHARSQRVDRLLGEFIPSKKNAPAREFFRLHGFACTAEHEGRTSWELVLSGGAPECPPWIERSVRLDR